MINQALFSHKRDNWKTPEILKKELNDIFRFNFDPCPVNPTFDGLSIAWSTSNFVNPPYNKEIKKWLEKAICEKGLCVFLLPARTDTKWFHDLVIPYADTILFLKGRLKFDDQKNSAPFPSMIVIFKKTT